MLGPELKPRIRLAKSSYSRRWLRLSVSKMSPVKAQKTLKSRKMLEAIKDGILETKPVLKYSLRTGMSKATAGTNHSSAPPKKKSKGRATRSKLKMSSKTLQPSW